MAVNLSPVGGVAAQFFTSTGAVLTGGKLYTYAAGTTTPAVTYTTSQGNVPWTNPVVLDAAGRVPGSGEIWLTDGIIYKFVLKDSNDVLIATYDNITGINSNAVAYTNQQEIVTATAGQTVFNLGISYQPATNSLSVFVDGVNQYGPGAQYSYVETDSNTVTFNTGLHVGAEVKFTTTQQQGAGAVDASQVTYDPPFTNSVTTNVETKLAQYVSVMDFGAVGDGVTDDASAIQAAYDYMISIGGGTIYLPATQEGYKINTAINCTNGFYGVDFVGGGSASLPNARPNDDALGTTIWLNTGTVGFDLTGCATIGIKSMTLDTFHTTKVTNPARIGILSGRTVAQPNSFNHRFTDLSVFMKTTGDAVNPSIALYASNVELMTCINCWLHGDISTVLTNTGLYNAASPFVSIVNTAVSATCNTFVSCKLISVSGVGPALRLNQTVNNTIIGTYFGNDVDDSTYPAILCTSAVQKLFVKGFQSEGRTEFLKVTGNLIECEFYGTHASTNAITPICNFDNAGNVHDCSFDIYNSATVSGYSAYTGTVNYLANSYFNLGYGGNFAVTCTTFQGNSFNKLGAAASYTGIPNVSSDATINGVYLPSFYVVKKDYPFQKTNATNNSQFVFASVVIPNSEVNAIIEIPYTLNSADGQLVRTGRLRVNAARYGGNGSVVSMSEEAAQVALQTVGTETISASFAVGATAGAVNATQTVELTVTINSSLGNAGYIRGIATVQSAYFTNGLVQNHIYVQAV